MSTWGAGYVTDIEYSDGFYPGQAPASMALAAVMAGFEPPALDGHFSYCELGCGRGKTSMVLAAINPDAEFHAIDFNPAHIAHAREQARLAGLRNITFHECSFDELISGHSAALPMFDLVTMHGVWTWIAPKLKAAILTFLNARLNPGGLVYVSYNALPAWSQAAPLQRLVRELAAATPQRSDLAVARAIEQIDRFAKGKLIAERYRDAAAKRFKGTGKTLSYLAHEYLNEHWQPAYFADVAREMGGAKLSFVGCAELLKNFHNLVLNEEQRALIAEIPSPELRETLKDFCTDNWFRQDLFVRGARRMSEGRREQLLAAQRLTLMRPAPEALEIGKPDGSRWRPDAAVYGAILSALRERPHTVAELLSLKELPSEHLVRSVELVGTLAGTGVAGLYREASAAQIAGAEGLNALLEAEPEIPLDHGAVIAVPAAGVGVALSAPEYALYRTLKRGETPAADALATRFIKRCRDQGGHPVLEDKAIEDEAQAQSAVTRDYEIKIERLVPLWRTLGML
jgi:predicted O-methyltransferase YrrM